MQSSSASNATSNQRNAGLNGSPNSDESSSAIQQRRQQVQQGQQQREQIPYDPEADSNPQPVVHPFVVLTARTQPGERSVKIAMPDERYKLVCGAVTSVGSTIVLGSYPESSSVWCAVHDPARPTAHIVLKVIALFDEANAYETTVKRQQYKTVAAAAAGDDGINGTEANPRGLLEHRLLSAGPRSCVLTCAVPSKYLVCGGGFYSPMPIVSSQPVSTADYARALTTKREADAYGGGGWAVSAPCDDRLVVFAVGLRVRRSAGVSTNISVTLDGGVWRASLPEPQNTVVVHLGGSNAQDPAAAALYLAPSEASKIAIYRAPPNVWAQYRTPYRSIEDRERDLQYTKATI